MSLGKAKVYSDGGHYIAIQKITRPKRKKPIKKTTDKLKEKFEKVYQENKDKKKRERTNNIEKELQHEFKTNEELKTFVKDNLDRKFKNIVERRKRLKRKIFLNSWNYFCTFTYDNKLHDENSFKTKLSNCFKHLCSRKNWAYIGVYERSPENNRLHFHGLFNIPNMIGSLTEQKDYSTKTGKMQITHPNTFFLKKFGRNDFSVIDNHMLTQASRYLLKYIEKTGAKITASKNVYPYIISDIMDEDILCPYGIGDKKFVLADNFKCFDEGVLIGHVNPEVIAQMPKSN